MIPTLQRWWLIVPAIVLTPLMLFGSDSYPPVAALPFVLILWLFSGWTIWSVAPAAAVSLTEEGSLVFDTRRGQFTVARGVGTVIWHLGVLNVDARISRAKNLTSPRYLFLIGLSRQDLASFVRESTSRGVIVRNWAGARLELSDDGMQVMQ